MALVLGIKVTDLFNYTDMQLLSFISVVAVWLISTASEGSLRS